MKRQQPAIALVFIWICCWQLFRFDGNWTDVLPYARAQFDPRWLSQDWYLHADISYRRVFNWIAGPLYSAVGIEATFLTGRMLIYALYSVLLVQFFDTLKLPRWSVFLFLGFIAAFPNLGAGEWWIDEFDTKAFSYLAAFTGLLFFVQGRVRSGFFALGLSASFRLSRTLFSCHTKLELPLAEYLQPKANSFP